MASEFGEDFELIRTVCGNITSVVMKKLEGETRYKFRVAFLGVRGEQKFSEESEWIFTKGEEMTSLF